ncbi:hypothetical protein GA0070616_4423 [Micromonospora nigra]|uniref:Uncharacterized protein n=1 Tax=Micromonospora nigra TaxID=145857 RepID=A0A1C6SRS6_9ACTN|nr:hypothetical protein GA0070616_4423 [Micromonospora nigra]
MSDRVTTRKTLPTTSEGIGLSTVGGRWVHHCAVGRVGWSEG